MHRQRTRLAARVNRVASAIERRGIAATYELHDRALSNRRSRRLFAREQPRLGETQRQVLARLDADGYAVLPFADLAGAEAWERVAAAGDAFAAATESGLAAEARGEGAGELRRRAGKEFLVRRYSFDGVTLDLDEPWLAACLSPPLLDLANAYLRMWSKLSYVDWWYSIPQPAGTERVASQLWHFDFDDRHLLKAFVYLVDVDESAGPFEYVPGSQPGGRYHDVRPWAPMAYGRVPEQEVAARVPRQEVRTFTAPRGTLILCNTSGLHRGGFATGKPRVLATATYCSPASLAALSVRNYGLAGTLGGPDNAAARFAAS
ncbi:MAG TPA: phytanoyl-CoA dioxygenase family protein [Gaiellaceae bacterium]|nr:phytanoyl-CoA dioxygenase family protein [Gaiellaceae bacterium]